MRKDIFCFGFALLAATINSCIYVNHPQEVKSDSTARQIDSSKMAVLDTVKKKDSLVAESVAQMSGQTVNTKNVPPTDVVTFAERLIGTPYKYASTDPAVGFDCSGFITYVFNHFGIAVPRSSIDFTNVGKTILTNQAKPGDLILFTGTDSTERFVGHMGIVVTNKNDTLQFIHSSSGKANGVTITPLNNYYKGRYMKTIRVFPQNN